MNKRGEKKMAKWFDLRLFFIIARLLSIFTPTFLLILIPGKEFHAFRQYALLLYMILSLTPVLYNLLP